MDSKSLTSVENITPSSTMPTVDIIAKWGKERVELRGLSHETTIGQVKELLSLETNVLPKRQKLIGLSTISKQKMTDCVPLSDIKIKTKKNISENDDHSRKTITHSFILMGTPEEQIFVDPEDKHNLPDVIDDFELDFNAGSDEWIAHIATEINLKKFTENTSIHIMNEPRLNKPLMVLDLDHTLLDFSSKKLLRATTAIVGDELASELKRPFMDEFLASVYTHYDLVVWSQTSWRWLETKLTELGMLTHPGYRFCFVLDKTSMFSITSSKRDGKKVKHFVKPLEIIWNKFRNRWGDHNTVHLDDLSRNFALNLHNGLKVRAYHRKKGSKAKKDRELFGLARYLEELALKVKDFKSVDFSGWENVANGSVSMESVIRDITDGNNKKNPS